MHRPDREEESPPRSRSSSRRNSGSLSRRSSIKKEKEAKSSMSSAPSSTNSTPKKMIKAQNLDFVVTGKQLLKRGDRANSLPGSCRRASVDVIAKSRRAVEPKRLPERVNVSTSSKSQETSVEDDMSLDLSQVSDFEDTNSKYGIRKFQALATSTPKVVKGKPRSGSLQSQIHSQRMESRRAMKSLDCTRQSFNFSRDSYKTLSSASPQRYGTDLDYSSVSPEYSGQSSTELSPRASQLSQVVSPRSQDTHVSSCCISNWADCSENSTIVEHLCDGEWSSFWANYNNSLSKVPMKGYYDQCPTPYRTETFDLADFGELDVSDGSRKRSPDSMEALNNIIRNQGLHLTPRETQNIIKCAHLLGNVLTKAIERRSKSTETDDPEVIIKKKMMTLDLKETVMPIEVKEEKKCESATTQTDISLPNTKSAPRIFENILRQLSRSSIDVSKIEIKDDNKDKSNNNKVKEQAKGEDTNEVNKDKVEANKDSAKATPVKDKEAIETVTDKKDVEENKDKQLFRENSKENKKVIENGNVKVIEDKMEVQKSNVVDKEKIETPKDNLEGSKQNIGDKKIIKVDSVDKTEVKNKE